MSYEHLRRSSRIPKELAILLTGSDMDGKGFSEMTKTVLLSRHGAGIISTYKLSAEQEIILRYLDTNKEALVRIVGRIGSEGENYTYGVSFADPSNIDFWGIDFAPVSEREKKARSVLLECRSCSLRETVEHTDVESDVLVINEGIVRYCKQCHDSTLWKRASETPSEVPEKQPVMAFAGKESPVGGSSFSGATSTTEVDSGTSGHFAAAGDSSSEIDVASSAEGGSGAAGTSVPGAQSAERGIPPVKPENRRKHVRMKVSYKACIRRSGFVDDIVTCEDMSKGGICFRSRKQYYKRTDIEVAVPYAPGGNAIFVPAEIAWVVEVTKDKLYRCGVEYRRPTRPS